MPQEGAEETFRAWLVDRKLLSDRTAEVYAAMVDFGLRRGDPLIAVRKARTKGSLRVAHASLRLWSEWTKNEKISTQADRIVRTRRQEVGEGNVRHVTSVEREKLLTVVRGLEEPYRSAMLIIVGSEHRLGPILDLDRVQADGAAHGEPVLFLSEDTVVSTWTPDAELRTAFAILGGYGSWERVQDLLGRSYQHAYTQLRILLRGCCRKAGIRSVKPGELTATSKEAEEQVA
jgi:hypothetical protein